MTSVSAFKAEASCCTFVRGSHHDACVHALETFTPESLTLFWRLFPEVADDAAGPELTEFVEAHVSEYWRRRFFDEIISTYEGLLGVREIVEATEALEALATA